MIVVANLELSGLLGFASGWIVDRARRPLTLLCAVVMVTGLLSAFLVNHAICPTVTPLILEIVLHSKRNPVPHAGALSNLASYVPAVLVLSPFTAPMRDSQRAWLTVAMASTLAGNFPIPGSIANLIVVQRARVRGVEIGFWEYFKVGAPLTLITIVIGVAFLTL